MNIIPNQLFSILGASTGELPWQQILIGLVVAVILFKIISFQIGMIIKVIITVAILATAVYFIQGM